MKKGAQIKRLPLATTHNNGNAVTAYYHTPSPKLLFVSGAAAVQRFRRAKPVMSALHRPALSGGRLALKATSRCRNVVQNTGGQSEKTKAWLAKYKAPVLVAKMPREAYFRSIILTKGVL